MDNTFFICSCLLAIGIANLASTSLQSQYNCDESQNCTSGLKRTFVAGFKDQLIQIEIDPQGHHTQVALLTTAKDITCLAYSPNSNNLYMIDATSKSLYSMNMLTKDSEIIFEFKKPSDISAMVYDYLDNNLFYCDADMGTVNVLNLDSMEMKVIVHFGDNIPMSIAVDPEDYIIFVAHKPSVNARQWRMDKFKIDGTERREVIASQTRGPITLHYDSDMHRIFWTDGFNGRIQSMDINGYNRKQLKVDANRPSGLTSWANDVFWINHGTVELMWTNKMNLDNTHRVMLNVPEKDTSDKRRKDPSSFSLAAIRKVRSLRRRRANVTPCRDDQFLCSSGLCIPRSWECDREIDCFDRSDEHTNCDRNQCHPTMHKFSCQNNRCIDRTQICNQVDDCGDFSDEIQCDHLLPHCLPTEHQCSGKNGECLPKTSVCNDFTECPNWDDEQQCHCLGNQYECANGKCIPKEWLCDGTDDCEDRFASDENNTYCKPFSLKSYAKNWTLCDYGFRCNSGDCIDRRFLCDNMTYDCPDKSDENGTCATSCLEPETKCDHGCISTPTGHICTCRKGFKLDNDQKSCIDIDECQANIPICSQNCTNQIGDYKCSCYQGFELRGDMRSCKYKGEEPTYFFAVGTQIRNMSLIRNRMTILYDDINDGIAGLDVDVHSGYIYFTIPSQGIVMRASLTRNADRLKISDLVAPNLIKVDWLTKNVYVIEGEANKQFLKVCSFDYMKCRDMAIVLSEDRVRAIAIDPINRFIFTALTRWNVSSPPQCRVHKMDMRMEDGGGPVLLTLDECDITSLALDIPGQTVYYSDYRRGLLSKMAYDGSKQILIYKDRQMPHSLQLFDNRLYLLERYGLMTICNLYDFEMCERYRIILPTSQMFTIGQISRQPRGDNMCVDKHKTICEVCIPTDDGPMCYCDGYSLLPLMLEDCPQVTPVDKNAGKVKISSKGTDSTKPPEDLNKSQVVWISVISSVAIIALAALMIGGWYYYKKRRVVVQNVPPTPMRFATLRARHEEHDDDADDSDLMPDNSPDDLPPSRHTMSGCLVQPPRRAAVDQEAL